MTKSELNNSDTPAEEPSAGEKSDFQKLVAHYQSRGLSEEAAYAKASRVRLRAHLETIAEDKNPPYNQIARAAFEWQELRQTGIENIPKSELPAAVQRYLHDIEIAVALRRQEEEGKGSIIKNPGGGATIIFGDDKEAESHRRKEHRARWERARKKHVDETWESLKCDDTPATTNRLLLELVQSLKDMSYWLAHYYPNGKLPKIKPRPNNNK